jgi:hypothetical protein
MTTKAFTLVVLVGFLDCVSGNEMSFSLLYLAPITLVTWFVGRRGGVAVASLSVLVGFGADMLSGHRFAHPLIPWWNTLMRVSFFLIVVTLLARLKRTYEGQTHMARELQASLTTLHASACLVVFPRGQNVYHTRSQGSTPHLLERFRSGGVGAGRNAHHSSSFSCVTIPRIWACRCIASSFVLRLNTTRGRLKSITVKVSNPNRAFLWTSEKICVTHASEPRAGWVRIK